MKQIEFMRSYLILPLIVVLGCSEGRGATVTKPNQCDATLWNHVYNPKRLAVINECITTSGVISDIGPDDDGDEHMLLHLDPGQESLVRKKNLKKKGGDLVVEVVCAHPPTLKKAKSACKNYQATIELPKVGDHVVVTGSFVNDTHNGWTEIHPATSIVKR